MNYNVCHLNQQCLRVTIKHRAADRTDHREPSLAKEGTTRRFGNRGNTGPLAREARGAVGTSEAVASEISEASNVSEMTTS